MDEVPRKDHEGGECPNMIQRDEVRARGRFHRFDLPVDFGARVRGGESGHSHFIVGCEFELILLVYI
jgi:hypothetical protein